MSLNYFLCIWFNDFGIIYALAKDSACYSHQKLSPTSVYHSKYAINNRVVNNHVVNNRVDVLVRVCFYCLPGKK